MVRGQEAPGNVVVVAADKLTSADLVEHSEAIASAILPDSSLYINQSQEAQGQGQRQGDCMIETTRPIRVSLTNTRRHNLSQLALFTPGSSYSTQFAPDLYLITEPWWRIGDEPDAPHFSVKEPAGYYPILPVQSVPAAERPRVFAYASSTRTDVEVFNRYDLAQDLDFLILEIRQGTRTPYLLVLLYNQDAPQEAQRQGRTFERFKSVVLPDMPIAIAMDANEHHHAWDSFAQASSRGERETFFLFRLCEQATYIIRAQDTVTALLQVQTIEGVGQLGGLKEL